MYKTILITGASSGIGKATAIFFSKKGWNVAATIREKRDEKYLENLPNLKIYFLDVTKDESIKNAINNAIKDFGKIDVIINNAGYGAVGAFEKANDEDIQKQFDVNVFGIFRVIRNILPYFRKQKGGMIINITSIGGIVTFPFYSVYHATKWAIEGFTESLQFELEPFNIKIKNIEPGAIKTNFYKTSQKRFKNENIKDYDINEEIYIKSMQKKGENAPSPLIVAKKIWEISNSQSKKIRHKVGKDAWLLSMLRKILPLYLFMSLIKISLRKK